MVNFDNFRENGRKKVVNFDNFAKNQAKIRPKCGKMRQNEAKWVLRVAKWVPRVATVGKQWEHSAVGMPGPVPRGSTMDRPSPHTPLPRVPTPPLAGAACYGGVQYSGRDRFTRLLLNTALDLTYRLVKNHHFLIVKNRPVKTDVFVENPY